MTGTFSCFRYDTCVQTDGRKEGQMFEGNWVTPYIKAKMERVHCNVIFVMFLTALVAIIFTLALILSYFYLKPSTSQNTTVIKPWRLVLRIRHKVKIWLNIIRYFNTLVVFPFFQVNSLNKGVATTSTIHRL